MGIVAHFVAFNQNLGYPRQTYPLVAVKELDLNQKDHPNLLLGAGLVMDPLPYLQVNPLDHLHQLQQAMLVL